MKTSATTIESPMITGDQLIEMGDIGPCELVDGRIVRMSPTGGEHGWLELNIGSRLRSFVTEMSIGWVLAGEVGIYTRRNPDRVRGADIVFVSKKRSSEKPPKGFLEMAPNLVIEIVSPSDRWIDIRQKIEEYLAIGIECVWIVNPGNRSILSYHSPTTIQKFVDGDTLKGEGELQGFELNVTSIFSE